MKFNINKLMQDIEVWSMAMPDEDIRVIVPDTSAKERKYLGLSALGVDCQRAAFYEFRKVAKKKFPGRMLRLFQRGHREEFFFVHMLRSLGLTIYEVDPKTGEQFKVSDFEGHLSGHMDGVCRDRKRLYVDVDKPFKVEFKTYNKDRFKELEKEGVRRSAPKYYVQMQGYLGYEPRLQGVLFCAVCKDDDSLHFEWLNPDPATFEMIKERAELILNSTTPPRGIAKRKSDFRCKFCDFKDNCFSSKPSLKSCRSCVHASPSVNKTWACALLGQKYGETCEQWEDCNR
jgi:hypothetical protein